MSSALGLQSSRPNALTFHDPKTGEAVEHVLQPTQKEFLQDKVMQQPPLAEYSVEGMDLGIYHESRKKLPIWKKIVKGITIWFIIDENMSKIMEKILILSENQKLRKSKMVNLGFC